MEMATFPVSRDSNLSTPTNQSPVTFSTLPPEIRLSIYEQLVEISWPRYLSVDPHKNSNTFSLLTTLRVSKQIYSEARQHIFSSDKFSISIFPHDLSLPSASCHHRPYSELRICGCLTMLQDRELVGVFRGLSFPLVTLYVNVVTGLDVSCDDERVLRDVVVNGQTERKRVHRAWSTGDEAAALRGITDRVRRVLPALQSAGRIGRLALALESESHELEEQDAALSDEQTDGRRDAILPLFEAFENIAKIDCFYVC